MTGLSAPQKILQPLTDSQDDEFKGKNNDKWCEFTEYLTVSYLHQLNKLAQDNKE